VELERNYNALEGDFEEFFPKLRAHVEARYASPSSNSPSSTRACP
jgi:hypothetical protein